jgi:hypothetical protein
MEPDKPGPRLLAAQALARGQHRPLLVMAEG